MYSLSANVVFCLMGHSIHCLNKHHMFKQIKQSINQIDTFFLLMESVEHTDRCMLCKCKFDTTCKREKDRVYPSRDHFVPRRLTKHLPVKFRERFCGWIVVPCCVRCNQGKGGMLPHEFAHWLMYNYFPNRIIILMSLKRLLH